MAVIYVVDDEPLLLDLISKVLQLGGHQVYTSASPARAAEMIVAAAPPADLVITEADMHPYSGFKLVNRLREKQVECPVIFTSWHHGLASAITDPIGRRAFMAKPFTADELRKAVEMSLPSSKVMPNRAS
ncbi:MAG TPA: response regulator [Bryobacteraceae bacterium]|jgi:DNA-binding NtrC family response regulator